ncbi:MAG: type II toxin-antitoxin system VapC family toxin [Phycisphaerales bacterium]
MRVVDSSAVLAVLLRERNASGVFKAIEQESTLLAPALLPYEIANALQVAVRRKRMLPEAVDRCIAHHLQLPWAFEMQTSELRLAAIGRLARSHGLTAYDAAYLELALHRACPIVSLDESLRAAARKEHVEVLPARVAA